MGIRRVEKKKPTSIGGVIKEKEQKRKSDEAFEAFKARVSKKRAAKKSRKQKKKQVLDTDYLYGDWLDSPSKAAKKKRKKFGYSGKESI